MKELSALSLLSRRDRAAAPARVLVALAAASTLAVAGCGDDEEESGGGAAALEIGIPAEEGQPLEVPASAEAGVAELTLDNTGQKPAEAQLVRVEGDHPPEEVAQAIGEITQGGAPLPEWFLAGGGVGTTPPGQTRTATQVLEPGTYYAFNLEQGGKPPVPEPIEVTGDPAGAELPTAPATITASEYTFETEGLTADTEEITFENAGEEPHHIIAAPLEKGATPEDIEQFIQSEEGGGPPSGPPPIDFKREVSTAVVEGGDTQVVDVQLDSGEYALLCFISDREGGPPHVAKGMLVTAQVE
jgi:hypothetical protein